MCVKSTINNLLIIEIDTYLSSKEIDVILTQRKRKFKKAIDHYPSYYRNNDRLVEDNTKLSNQLYRRLEKLDLIKIDTDIAIEDINSRIRFCKYQKNQLFSMHQDGVYYPNNQLESKYTFLLYLNDIDEFTGGETEFYTSKYDSLPIKTILPKKGKLIIFDHLLWHKGAKVISGNKYILRTDLIINRISKLTHHNGYIWNLLAIDHNKFLSAGRDTTIKIWNTNLELQKEIKIHTKSIIKMICINKTDFVSCSRDFSIKKWNLTGEVLRTIDINEMILNLLHLDTYIIAVGTSGNMYVFNLDLQLIKTIVVHTNWIWDIKIYKDTIIITCSEDGTVHLTNIHTSTTKCIYTHTNPLFSLCYSKNTNQIFTGSKDGNIVIISLSSKKNFKIKTHNDIIRTILYYKNNIISCGEDNKIIVSTIKSLEQREILIADNFLQDMIILNNTIYTAGFDGVISSLSL